MQKNRVMFVVNPVSGNGKTYKKWQAVENKLRSKGYKFDQLFTEAELHATEITAQALQSGYNHIIAVGGDGTINEVLNGFYCNSEEASKNAVLSVVPMGTGSDFSRGLNLSSNLNYIEKLLKDGQEQLCDVVCASYKGWDGREVSRYYINIADVGIGSETVYRVNRSSKAGGGFWSFLTAGLASIFSFKNPVLSVEVDGQEIYSGESTMTVISNGKYFGGGIMISPQAEIGDGSLEVMVFEGLSKRECLLLLPSLYKGKHLDYPRLRIARGQEVRVHSQQQIFLEMDGESPGTGNIHFKILPADLKLVI